MISPAARVAAQGVQRPCSVWSTPQGLLSGHQRNDRSPDFVRQGTEHRRPLCAERAFHALQLLSDGRLQRVEALVFRFPDIADFRFERERVNGVIEMDKGVRDWE